MNASKTTAEALRHDEDVLRLVQRIALAEGFHAIVVKCESFGLAQSLLDVLRIEVPQWREEPMHWVHLEPYQAHENLNEPISLPFLIEHILKRLVFPSADARGPNVVTIVDASRAMPQDDEAWQLLFQRMNERRNAIMRALSSVLLFLLPRKYDGLLARGAPDFWSICSSLISVRTPDSADEALMIPLLNDPATDWDPATTALDPATAVKRDTTVKGQRIMGYESLFPNERIREIEREIALLRSRLEENPDDTKTDDALVFWLNKLAEVASQEQHYQLGVEVTKQLVDASRKRIAKNPKDPRPNIKIALLLADLSRFLRPDDSASSTYIAEAVNFAQEAVRGEIHDPTILVQALQVFEASGSRHVLRADWDNAQADFERCRAVAERLVDREPRRIQWRKLLASSLHSLAMVHQVLGDIDRAIDTYGISLAQWREAEKLGDVSLEVLRKKADTIRELGMAHNTRKEWDQALDAYDESLATFRTALERHPEDTRLLHGFIETSAAMVSVHAQRNDFARARAVAARASDPVDRLLARNANDATARRCKGFFEFAHALACTEHEQSVEAMTHYRTALEMLEPLLTSDPADSRVVDIVKKIHQRMQDQRARLSNPDPL